MKIETQKLFSINFKIGKNIQTQIQSQNVNLQEAIGLLEMAKDQLMKKMRDNTQNVFNVEKKE